MSSDVLDTIDAMIAQYGVNLETAVQMAADVLDLSSNEVWARYWQAHD